MERARKNLIQTWAATTGIVEHRGFDTVSAYNDNALLIAVSRQPVSVRMNSYGH
jgi:hypothetical protein